MYMAILLKVIVEMAEKINKNKKQIYNVVLHIEVGGVGENWNAKTSVRNHQRSTWSALNPFGALMPSELLLAAPVSWFSPCFRTFCWVSVSPRRTNNSQTRKRNKVDDGICDPCPAIEWMEENRPIFASQWVFKRAGWRDDHTKAKFSILYPASRLCVSRRRWLKAPAAAATAVSFSSPPSTVLIPPLRPSVHPTLASSSSSPP